MNTMCPLCGGELNTAGKCFKYNCPTNLTAICGQCAGRLSPGDECPNTLYRENGCRGHYSNYRENGCGGHYSNPPAVDYGEIIRDTASKHYNVADPYKDNSTTENIEICKNQALDFSVGLINITGELNVGMMIRSACLMGAKNVYMFGRKKFDKRSTVGAENYINIVQYTYDAPLHADELILDDLRKLHHTIILCEQGGYELQHDNSDFHNRIGTHPLFVFGSESFGIPSLITDQVDETGDWEFLRVSIPQRGVLRSFNVSAAMNIIVWDYLKEKVL